MSHPAAPATAPSLVHVYQSDMSMHIAASYSLHPLPRAADAATALPAGLTNVDSCILLLYYAAAACLCHATLPPHAPASASALAAAVAAGGGGAGGGAGGGGSDRRRA